MKREHRLSYILIYAILASILCTVGGYGYFPHKFFYAFLVIFLGASLSTYFLQDSKWSFTRLAVADVCLILFLLIFIYTGDAKDRPILLLIFFGTWVLSILKICIDIWIRSWKFSYKRFLAMEGSWLSWLWIILMFDKLLAFMGTGFMIQVDFFHLLIAGFFWQVLQLFLLYKDRSI